jgi:hypothetical protein
MGSLIKYSKQAHLHGLLVLLYGMRLLILALMPDHRHVSNQIIDIHERYI